MNRKYFLPVVLFTSLIIITTAVSSPAKEAGRYQAMEIRVGKKSEYTIFILDTKDGHMWLLETKESRVDGKLSGNLTYHGRLLSGKKVGEIIFQFGGAR